MKWMTFVQTLHDADRTIGQIKDDLMTANPDWASFYRKTYLVLVHNLSQYEFKTTPRGIDMVARHTLLLDCKIKDQLLSLGRLFSIKKAEKDKYPNNMIIREEFRSVEFELANFPLCDLDIDDNFSIEIRFPWIHSEAIQTVKLHSSVKACKCKACINAKLR